MNVSEGCTPQPKFDLSTSEGGRGYLAEWFKTRLNRHDFTRYINERLAADFACALSSWIEEHIEQGEDPGSLLATSLIRAWVDAHGRPVPWAKAIEITAIATKMPEDEKSRLLAMDDTQPVEPLKLSEDVREHLQFWINSATQGEDADDDFEFAEQLGWLLDPVYRRPVAESAEIERLRSDIERLESGLRAIHDFAHDKSTGPALPDALWDIRSMASDALFPNMHSRPEERGTPETEPCSGCGTPGWTGRCNKCIPY